MVVCGIPLFFQEVAVGQYLGSGGMTFVGQLCPILKGVGYSTMVIVFLLDIYYCIILAWTIMYLIFSFVKLPDLPWSSCGKTLLFFKNYLILKHLLADNPWNTQHCFATETVYNRTTVNGTKTTSVEEFFE